MSEQMSLVRNRDNEPVDRSPIRAENTSFRSRSPSRSLDSTSSPSSRPSSVGHSQSSSPNSPDRTLLHLTNDEQLDCKRLMAVPEEPPLANHNNSSSEESAMQTDASNDLKPVQPVGANCRVGVERHSNENLDSSQSDPLLESKEQPIIEHRMLVRRREAGALIGKRGSNIKRLRETFRTSMFSIPDTGNGPERVVCIVTDPNSMEAIMTEITQLLMEKSPEKDDQIELKLLIHSSRAGSIIGLGGQSIKKLRNDSKAAIKIYELCCPFSNERVCAIKAKPAVVVSTIRLIQTILDQNPIKGIIKPYDALHFDPMLSDKYGGYLPEDGFDPISSSAQFNTQIHTGYRRAALHDGAHPAVVSQKHYATWRPMPGFHDHFECPNDNLHLDYPETPAFRSHHHQQHQNMVVVRQRAQQGLENTPEVPSSDCTIAKQTQQQQPDESGPKMKEHQPSIGQQASQSARFHPYAQTGVSTNRLEPVHGYRGHQFPLGAHRLRPPVHPIPPSGPIQARSHQHYHNHHQHYNQQQSTILRHPSELMGMAGFPVRCRHMRPCQCMFLPMFANRGTQALPFMQLADQASFGCARSQPESASFSRKK